MKRRGRLSDLREKLQNRDEGKEKEGKEKEQEVATVEHPSS